MQPLQQVAGYCAVSALALLYELQQIVGFPFCLLRPLVHHLRRLILLLAFLLPLHLHALLVVRFEVVLCDLGHHIELFLFGKRLHVRQPRPYFLI